MLKIVKVPVSLQMPWFTVSTAKTLKTVRWKVEDVTSDGVKIQKPAANIKLYVSVHILYNIPDAMTEAARVIQSKSSLQLYLCVNTQS